MWNKLQFCLLTILALSGLTGSFKFHYHQSNVWKYHSIRFQSPSTTIENDKIPQPFGPRAVVLAGFRDEKHFEILDDIIETVLGYLPPIVVLGKDDLSLNLQQLLMKPVVPLEIRDHVLPDVAANVEIPIVLFSGLDRAFIRTIIGGIKEGNGPDSGSLPKCCFAIAVMPALNKPLQHLFEEITEDFKENQILLKPSP